MNKPERIQLSRKKGWKMPENTVKVDRTTKFGNPFKVGVFRCFANTDDPNDVVVACPGDLNEAVDAFRWLAEQSDRAEMIQRDLRGKNLACWCRPGEPCHADVLLEIANR